MKKQELKHRLHFSSSYVEMRCIARRCACSVLAALTIASAVVGSSVADSIEWTSVGSDADLAQMRGGLAVAGVDIEFGVRMRTLINGQQVFESIFDLSDGGPRLVESTVTATSAVASATDQISLAVIPVTAGTVRIANSVADQAILTSLVVDATGQAIRHELSLDITVGNYSTLQNGLRAVALATSVFRGVEH